MQVVHLEDDTPVREVLKLALHTVEPDINVVQFVNSDDVMGYIQEHLAEIDLFILDIRVPGKLNGLDVAMKIRNMGSNKVIIITSAFQKPNALVLKTLNCEWIPKPWHVIDATQRVVPLVKESFAARQQKNA
jgi:DNA-binding response OmpR family regulator